jgi:hypothetical protein
MKITFRVEQDGEFLEKGSTSASCNGLDDVKNTIVEVLEEHIEKEVDAEFERSMTWANNNTFVIKEIGGDKQILCKVSGLSQSDAIELEDQAGDL